MEPVIGGQAVIEGVMMKNQEKIGIAILKNNKIQNTMFYMNILPSWKKIPFLRGVVVFIELLYIGTKSLLHSVEAQAETNDEKISNFEIGLTLASSVLFGVILFIGIPFLLSHLLTQDKLWFNIIDGVFRLTVFILYLLVISKMKDIQRVFQFHGAEHKAINCYESGEKLTVANCMKASRFHPRCGTSFVLIVLVISIVVFSLILTEAWYFKFLSRIILIPVIGSISYEILRLSAKHQKNKIFQLIIKPGLMLQRITTKEPDEQQMKVGIEALKLVL